MKKNHDRIKYNTVPNGRIMLSFLWAGIIVIILTGIILLPKEEGIAVLLVAVALIVILVLFYLNKYSNVLVFTDENITLRKQCISWRDVYITAYCHSPNMRNNYDIYFYFSDHYLTIQEVCSWKVKKKGFYIIVNYKRAQYILSKDFRGVKVLNNARIDRDGVMSMIFAHNAVISLEG